MNPRKIAGASLVGGIALSCVALAFLSLVLATALRDPAFRRDGVRLAFLGGMMLAVSLFGLFALVTLRRLDAKRDGVERLRDPSSGTSLSPTSARTAVSKEGT